MNTQITAAVLVSMSLILAALYAVPAMNYAVYAGDDEEEDDNDDNGDNGDDNGDNGEECSGKITRGASESTGNPHTCEQQTGDPHDDPDNPSTGNPHNR
jgi:hypothetical protein